jgi:hypothetical protein
MRFPGKEIPVGTALSSADFLALIWGEKIARLTKIDNFLRVGLYPIFFLYTLVKGL